MRVMAAILITVLEFAALDAHAQSAQTQAQLKYVQGEIHNVGNELNVNKATQRQPGLTQDQLKKLQARAADLDRQLKSLLAEEQKLLKQFAQEQAQKH